jgi:hypothetical protein
MVFVVYLLILRLALRGFYWAAGPPSSALFRAIVIIPNSAGMFNENRTFLIKNLLDAGFWILDS